MRIRFRTLPTASIATALAMTGVLAGATASSAAEPTIHPGVQTYTEGAQCTANFVFTDGTDFFIGQSAHCSGTGAATDTDGCDAKSLPLGTKVEIDGASQPGVMVYNSWIAMQKAATAPDSNACAYNDFALVKIHPDDRDKVSAEIPVFGDVTGTDTDGVAPGETVYSYGNSGLRGGITQLSPKEGVSLGTTGGGWTHPVYTLTPGVPGDSGSAFVNSEGEALGVLSTLSIAPLAGSNNVTDLAKALDYANAHNNEFFTKDVRLVEGDAFDGSFAVLRGLLG